MSFQVGDRVRLNARKWHNAGCEGTVRKIDLDWVYVDFDAPKDPTDHYDVHDFVKIDPVYNVGDRVRLGKRKVDGFPWQNTGCEGTVVRQYANRLVVEFDKPKDNTCTSYPVEDFEKVLTNNQESYNISGMNEFQTKVFNYLTEDGHPDRKMALKELMVQGHFVNTLDVSSSQRMLESRFGLWEREGTFCKDGLQRARTALLESNEGTVRILLEVGASGVNSLFGTGPKVDGGVVGGVQHLLRGAQLGNVTLSSVRWLDYEVNPTDSTSSVIQRNVK